MSRLLLDTHVVIWWDSGSRSLGRQTRKAIAGANAVQVSAASEWELSIKSALGRVDVRRSIGESAHAAGFEQLQVTFEHAREVRRLEGVHKDPFDRLLVAVAIVERLTIVSADAVFERYPVHWLDARK
jgi:PIN domain nuclease of toxin-antitoxin system